MKSTDEIANHPRARLYRDIVERLRATGSPKGAENAWIQFTHNRRLWSAIITYGLNHSDRQQQLTKVAFPDCGFVEVDAALRAGNKLKALYELACGAGSIAKDATGTYKFGRRGYKVVLYSRSRGSDRD